MIRFKISTCRARNHIKKVINNLTPSAYAAIARHLNEYLRWQTGNATYSPV